MSQYVKDKTAHLRLLADVTHGLHQQYSGYFNDWVLAEATRQVNYKGGSRLCRGRMVLASPNLASFFDPDTGHECAADAGVLRLY